MNWINLFGLAVMGIMMLPNILFAAKNKDAFQNIWQNKTVETLEQIGRFGCFGLMAVILPGCGFGFSSKGMFLLYLLGDGALLLAYCLIWAICFYPSNANRVFRALALSILPSLIFLLSGVVSHYLPLVIAAIIFAPCHIAISYKNAVAANRGETAGCTESEGENHEL